MIKIKKIINHLFIKSKGHTSSQAGLFAQMGFESLFLSRIDYLDQKQRVKERNMETVWKPEEWKTPIFTSVTSNLYHAPKGICFTWCEDYQNINLPSFNETTVNNHRRVERIVEYLRETAMSYRHQGEIYHLVGDDFAFNESNIAFKNLDLLIEKINDNETYNINLFYSTPSRYIDKIKELKDLYSKKTDDFMPYADNKHSFWTGYFSSRPATKVHIKKSGRHFQSLRALYSQLHFREGK